MYWKLREARLEFDRMKSLDELEKLRLRDKLVERQRHEVVLREMEDFILELRQTVQEKEVDRILSLPRG